MAPSLNAVATAAPEWLAAVAPDEWFGRYARRWEDARLPRGEQAKRELAETIGADGLRLLAAVFGVDDPTGRPPLVPTRRTAPSTPAWLRQVPAVETLRQIWVHHYVTVDGTVRWRDPEQLAPASLRADSPYDPEAHFGSKRDAAGRGLTWSGYKAHLTEACDTDGPHVITHVATTSAPTADVTMTPVIHAGLADRGLLPAVHLADTNYADADLLVASRADYDVELLAPVRPDVSWQAKAGEGFDVSRFAVDWDARTVTCPQGRESVKWTNNRGKGGNVFVHVEFARRDCLACEVREKCTRSATAPRALTLRQREQHEALQRIRGELDTPEWRARYAARAGVEGTISQATHAFGLRHARYVGLAKTHLQHVLTAAAMNLTRTDAWLTGAPLAQTRTSRFAALRTTARAAA